LFYPHLQKNREKKGDRDGKFRYTVTKRKTHMKGMERQRKGEDKTLTRGAESESMTEVSSYMLLVFILDWKEMELPCYDFGKENGRHFYF
jgi:hypothetical protein